MSRILPLLVFLLAVIEIIATNRFAGSGGEIRDINLALDKIRMENDFLEQRVASASSLLTIAAKAQEYGFVEPTKSQYMTLVPEGALSVALRAFK